MTKSRGATARASVETREPASPDRVTRSSQAAFDTDIITFEEYLDIPEVDDSWAVPVEITPDGEIVSLGPPPSPAPMEALTLHLPPDLIAYFRAYGPDWERRIEDVLRAARSVLQDTAERQAAECDKGKPKAAATNSD